MTKSIQTPFYSPRPTSEVLLKSGMSAALGTFLTQPLEVLKTRLQAAPVLSWYVNKFHNFLSLVTQVQVWCKRPLHYGNLPHQLHQESDSFGQELCHLYGGLFPAFVLTLASLIFSILIYPGISLSLYYHDTTVYFN